MPETRVDKQAIFKDYGLYDFNKDPHWGGFYEEMADKCDEDVESCKKMNKEVGIQKKIPRRSVFRALDNIKKVLLFI